MSTLPRMGCLLVPVHPSIRVLPLLVLLVLTACPPSGPDGGEQEVADLCDSREEALSSPECQLTPGVPLEERYLSFERDTDWYSVRMPATVGPRSLLRVTAVYPVPLTAVNLSVSLLGEDGSALAPRRVDVHGEGPPKPVEFLLPFTEPGATLFLLLGDEPAHPSRPGYDARNPYVLTVEVLDNPDAHEPNDTAAQATLHPLVQAAAAGRHRRGRGPRAHPRHSRGPGHRAPGDGGGDVAGDGAGLGQRPRRRRAGSRRPPPAVHGGREGDGRGGPE